MGDTTPRLLYASERAAVYCGDCRYALDGGAGHAHIAEWAPTVLLTDPPYAHWRAITKVDESRAYDFEADAAWFNGVALWYSQWLPDARRLFAGPDAAAWLFLNPHYVGFALHWTTWLDWPLQAVAPCSGTETRPELLLRFSDGAGLPPETAISLYAALRGNTYGNGKPVAVLREIARCSPPGAVLDPFCGDGSTLEAAWREGRRAVGFEIEEEPAARAAALMERLDRREA